MSNIIIIIILILTVTFGVRESIKHFHGEGSCCGGTAAKPIKKRLKNKIIKKYELNIKGMHCKNCVNIVTREINDIDGAMAKVSLKNNMAKVYCDREIDIEAVKEKIRKKGYECY